MSLSRTLRLLVAVAVVGAPATAQIPVATAADLDLLRTMPGQDFVLVADLDLSGTTHVPIGTAATPFTGTLDGDGHAVANLALDDCFGLDDVGLFGVTDGATIVDVHLVGVKLAADERVGALVGQGRDTTIVGCSATGTVRGRSQVGGLAGFLGNTDLRSSWTDVDVGLCDPLFLPGKWHGGLVGHVHPYRFPGRDPSNTGDGGFVKDCHALGDVRGYYVAGGLVGNFHGSEAVNCFARGAVETEYAFAGGLLGYVQEEPGLGATPVPLRTRIVECTASGPVTANAFGNLSTLQSLGIWDFSVSLFPMPSAGGFVAYCEGGLDGAEVPAPNVVIERCAARGDVATLEPERTLVTPTGGFVGFTEIETAIRECVATGDVDAPDMGSTGGFVGWGEGVVEDSSAHGDVVASDRSGAFGGQCAAIRNAVTGTPGPFGGKFRRCAAYGDFTATYDDEPDSLVGAGGFVGYLFSDVELEDCVAYGQVTSLGGWVGGFVGHASRNTIRRCAAFGPVVTSGANAGGFLGRSRLDHGVLLEDCAAHGDVLYVGPGGPASEAGLGGFVGSAEVSTTVRRCVSTGAVLAEGTSVGGFVGAPAWLSFSGCHWDDEAALQSGAQPTGVQGHPTAAMWQQATYVGWDFASVWEIVEGETYPAPQALP